MPNSVLKYFKSLKLFSIHRSNENKTSWCGRVFFRIDVIVLENDKQQEQQGGKYSTEKLHFQRTITSAKSCGSQL